MTLTYLNFLFLIVGLIAALIINMLADYLPSSSTPLSPQFHSWGWSRRKRPALVFGSTAVIFFCLPFWLTGLNFLFFISLYIAILILIIVTDLEHRLIFNVVIYPATVLAFVGSFFINSPILNWKSALLGAVIGFLIFYFFYWLANRLYGEGRIALGMGDVKLAMLLGMMMGFPAIFYCLLWGIILGGVITLLLLLSRRVGRGSALPYGQYLAISGIFFLVWGTDYVINQIGLTN